MYIYIYREREREKYRCVCIHIYIYIYIHICIYLPALVGDAHGVVPEDLEPPVHGHPFQYEESTRLAETEVG